VVGGMAPWLSFSDPLKIDLRSTLSAPSCSHWSGTDELGRDVVSRIVYASRSTLLISSCATGLALVLGTLLGLAAGWLGGLIDRIVRFAIDLLWSVPFVIFVILIVAIVGVSRAALILTIGGINWVTSARVVRAEVARLKSEGFILTAVAYGFSSPVIARDQILPSLRPVLLVLTAYGASEVLTLESGLAFIGLALPPPQPTWGGLLAEGLSYFSVAPWLVASSALVITLTLASLQVLAHRFERADKFA
jgi:peptide/nickel transport system permease protein